MIQSLFHAALPLWARLAAVAGGPLREGLPVVICPGLAMSARRPLFAAEREGLLVFEFGCVTFELLRLLGFQPRLLVEGRSSAYQAFVLLDILPH